MDKKSATLRGLQYLIKYRLSAPEARRRKTLCGAESFSQAGQDLFALLANSFKTEGTYVEIGAHDPVRDSNTFLLEHDYQWRGVSFEIDELYSYFFNRLRHNNCVCGDATKINFEKVFIKNGLPKYINYLQIDIDPGQQSLLALQALPLEDYRFGAITFEHDRYQNGDAVMLESRRILHEYGYVLLMPNIHNDGLDVEDWWIDPIHADRTILELRQSGPLDYRDAIRLGLNYATQKKFT